MHYIEAPQAYTGNEKSIFLAGGITNCPDWQHELTALLKDEALVILNPRRKTFHENPNAAREQIIWEYKHLRKATAISFWFPKEAICPIALYELGAWSMTDKELFIGIHPDYPRRADVEVQTKLVRPNTWFVYDLCTLADSIKRWSKQ
ncbi:MAG: nucleoside 2-deoxyribosyltransferase domain-containing protein [archaeon]